MRSETLRIASDRPVRAQNGGRFVWRGEGGHPDRVINSYELICVDRGVLAIEEAGRRFDVGPGQTLILWPGRRHLGLGRYPKELSFYWVHFTIVSGRPVRGKQLAIQQTTKLGDPDRLVAMFHRFLEDQESGRLTRHAANLVVTLMLCEVADAAAMQSELPDGGAMATAAAMADQWIARRLGERLTTSGVAKSLGYNPDYLGRVYRKATGRTLTEAIHAARLREAARRLREGDGHIDQIAARCGFGNVGYFRRLFKRRQGITPLAYRRLHLRCHIVGA